MNTIALLTALYRIDHSPFSIRDIMTLYTIITHPGCSGQEVCKLLGFPHRSAVQCALPRLIQEGLIEDRRTDVRKTVATVLHVTDKGRKFWTSLITAGEQENAST